MMNSNIMMDIQNDINIDYNELFGEKWVKVLEDFLYLDRIKDTLFQAYCLYEKGNVYPNKKDLFKSFRMCDPAELKIVIIGDEPYKDGTATGIPFAKNVKPTKGDLSDPLYLIEKCINEKIYKGLKLAHFDYSLEEWAEQGILLLDTAFTTEDKKSHLFLWKPFIYRFLKELNDVADNVIYILWGKEAMQLSHIIDQKRNFVLKYIHPKKAYEVNTPWICSSFNKANNILFELGEEQIIW